MEKLLSIARNVEIIIGYKYAVAYNFDTLKVYEFDKQIGELLEKYLPLTEDTIIRTAKKEGIITRFEEHLLKTLIKHLVKNNILQIGQGDAFLTHKSFSMPVTTTLVLEILTKCNFHCRHCYLGDRLYSKERLEVSVLHNIILDAKKKVGVNRVQITGGNPSLHPDIIDIIELLQRYSFKIIYFSNGVKLTDKILSSLRKADAALHVSIYGMSNESGQWLTGDHNYFDNIMKSIDLIEKHELKIRSLDFMAVEENIHEIEHFIEFCKKESYPYRFDSPASVGNAITNKIKNIRERIIDIEPCLESFDMSKAFRLNSCEFDQPTILANGDITFCVLSNRNFNDYILGNVHKNTFKEIWFSDKTKQLFKETNVNEQEICKECEYKYLCGGICPFSRKFFKMNLTKKKTPNCPRYQNKKFRTWEIKC